MRRVYLDHNATTPMRSEVRACLVEALDAYGNASSVHAAGQRARLAVDAARERIAIALGVDEDEIVFTAGGTAGNNLALFGVLRPLGFRAGLVTSAVEHSAILEPAEVLEREGHPVRRLPVDAHGRPDLGELPAAVQETGARLVSLMAANNEVGTRVDLASVSRLLGDLDHRPLLHTDAVQALGRGPLDLRAAGVDLATFSAHKLGGPLGLGVLYRRKGISLAGITHGGGQEGGLWPGTENVPAIVATALAIQLAVLEREEYARHCCELTRELWQSLLETWPDAQLLGPPIEDPDRLPNTLNVSLSGVDGRVLITRLDLAGLEVSAGSACASGSVEPSHVLRAMGLDDARARAGLRMSVGRDTTREDIHMTVDILRKTLS